VLTCRRGRRLAAALFLAPLAVGACSDDDDPPPAPAALEPSFDPAGGSAGVTASTVAPSLDSTPTTAPGTGGAPAAGAGGGTATPAVHVDRASIGDPAGDATPALADRAPAWADVTGAVLERSGDQLRLQVAFAAPVPDRSADGDHTMNVAAFVDVDGDGEIDYEVWGNLADTGWGSAWYDDTSGAARFGEDSGVAASVEQGSLVLRFPATHVGGAASFRWSVATEWGRYEAIGTVAAARDDAPDADGAAPFPG